MQLEINPPQNDIYLASTMDATIRHFQIADQRKVLEISADTAFFGEPVEAFLDDRHLYIDAFGRYYTDQEEQYAWVAESSEGVVGFLFGCADTPVQVKRWRSYILRVVLLKALSGKYKLGKKTASFAWGMLKGTLRGEQANIDLVKFPAHLQINVSDGYRGAGLGRRLIEAYLEQLMNLKIQGVHLETTSHNKAACHLYEKIGFQMLDEKPNRFWTRMLGYAVNNRSYGLILGSSY
jgi:ribosomal protein S18 acetylase RimI-like enzyme